MRPESRYFVIDVYTRRVLQRHGILGAEADYDEAQSVFHANIEPDVGLYNYFHAAVCSCRIQLLRNKTQVLRMPFGGNVG